MFKFYLCHAKSTYLFEASRLAARCSYAVMKLYRNLQTNTIVVANDLGALGLNVPAKAVKMQRQG